MLMPWTITTRPPASVIQRPAWPNGSRATPCDRGQRQARQAKHASVSERLIQSLLADAEGYRWLASGLSSGCSEGVQEQAAPRSRGRPKQVLDRLQRRVVVDRRAHPRAAPRPRPGEDRRDMAAEARRQHPQSRSSPRPR